MSEGHSGCATGWGELSEETRGGGGRARHVCAYVLLGWLYTWLGRAQMHKARHVDCR